jgi:hypothetical protein
MTEGETWAGARRRAATGALAWGLLFFACAQLALALAMEHWRPELRDLEYGAKRARLRARLAEHPGRPLLLVLGSSRTNLGIHPAALPPLPAEPVVFNASIQGAGPVMELICLHRLLDDGIRPDWLVLECWPPNWHQDGDLAEFYRIPVSRLAWSDLRVLRRYHAQPARLYEEWCLARMAPWWSSRFAVMMQYARDWLPREPRRDDMWKHIDATGWLPYLHSTDPEEVRRRTPRMHKQYAPILDGFHVSAVADRAWHEILTLCRREGIRVALLYMPESLAFRSWYPPAVATEGDGYLVHLAREYDVPLIDTRTWCPYEDFADCIHLLPTAADRFTERLGCEVLPRLLEDGGAKPPAPRARR